MATANYPASQPNIPDVPDFMSQGPMTHPEIHDQTTAELEAVCAELGTAPRGSDATVKDRLIRVDAELADIDAASWVTTARIANLNVTTAKIAAGAVDNTKIAAATITGGNIAAGAIINTHIQDGEVTIPKLHASVLEGAWLSNTVHTYFGADPSYYKRVGNMVFFHFQGTQTSFGGGGIDNLPAGYRPASTFYFTGINVASGVATPFGVAASGDVSATSSFGAGSVGNVWAFNCWFPV